MQLQPTDLIGAFYADDSLLWSAQDCVNWLPTVAMQKGTRTEAKLATPPGLSYFTQCGDGPVRGARDVEGKLFVVSGNGLYEVAYDGTPTLRGTIPGVGLVSMSHNKRGYGNQLLIVNGDAGYVWDTNAATLTRITDEGYPGAVQVDYLDHYLIQVEPWGRFWFHSNLDNATDYNTLDQYDAEAAPDKMIGIGANQLEAVVFSQKTIEFFANTGAATGTFQSKRIVIERGCASRHTIVKLDNTLMWLGNDGIFYRLNGYGAQPISTGPIHRAIAGFDWANAFGFVWEDKGYKVAYWTFPDGQTWGYDATQPPGYQWHRRESYGLNRWRLNTCTGWQRRWIGGDYRTGVLYLFDWDAQHEMGEPLVSERTGGTANANQNEVICPYVEFIFDTGGPAWDGESGLPSALSVTGNLPDGTVGDSGTLQYAAAGGVAPYVFSVLSGSLPPGAPMNSSGLINYTYTASGDYAWVVQVVDAAGNQATVADTASIQALEWIGSSLGGTSSDIVPSPDGMDWTATGWTVPNYSDGFLLRRPSDGAVVAHNAIVLSYKFGISLDNGATFSMYDTVGMNATGHIVGWSGGYWHCSSTSNATRVSDAGVQTSVASTTGFNTMCIADDRIIGFKSLRIWHADETGDNWADVLDMPFTSLVTTFRAKAHGSTVCLAAYADLGATLDLHVIWSDDNGDTFADTTPMSMADPAPSTAPCVWHDEVMGLWAVTLHNRVVFGPTPGALEEAAYTFPSAVNDIGSDGEKFVFACTGHIVTTSDFVTFTQVHASGAKSVLAYPPEVP